MANEKLGIFEELQERAERYKRYVERDRYKAIVSGPASNGARATTVNPFERRLRPKNGTAPYHHKIHYGRRRPVFPESSLGLSVVTVMQAVAIESKLSIDDLLGPQRHRRLAWPRLVAQWAIDRYCPHYSLAQIGQMFHRDHTSVMHGIRVTEERLAIDHPFVKELVTKVRQRLAAAAEGG